MNKQQQKKKSPPVKKQLDLKTAYKILIKAYLRTTTDRKKTNDA